MPHAVLIVPPNRKPSPISTILHITHTLLLPTPPTATHKHSIPLPTLQPKMKLSFSSLVLASAMLFVGATAGEPAATNLRGVETKKRE